VLQLSVPELKLPPVAGAPPVRAPPVAVAPPGRAPPVAFIPPVAGAPPVLVPPVAGTPPVAGAPPAEREPPVAGAPPVLAPAWPSMPPVAGAPPVLAPPTPGEPPVAIAPPVPEPPVSVVETVLPTEDAELPPVPLLTVAPPVTAGWFVLPPTSDTGGSVPLSVPPQAAKVRPIRASNGDENGSLDNAITPQDVRGHEMGVRIHQPVARMRPMRSQTSKLARIFLLGLTAWKHDYRHLHSWPGEPPLKRAFCR
jgi:hypothetical protein